MQAALRLVDRICNLGTAGVDPALAMYVRRLNAFTLLTGTLVLGVAMKRFGQGAPIAGTVEASGVLTMYVVRIVAMRRPTMEGFRIAGRLSVMLGLYVIVGSSLVLGQLSSPSLLYLGLLPLSGGYYAGARGALRWGVLAFAAIALVGASELIARIPPEVEQTRADMLATLLVVLSVTTGFACTAQRGIDRHLAELQEREDQIRAQAAELVVARDAALAASRMKSAFLANMSHELRTPMHIIIGMTDIALECELDEEPREHLQRARAASLSLLGILNDVLDLAKIEAGKMELAPGPLDVRATVDEVIALFVPSAAAKGLRLIGVVDRATPDAARGDASRLRQVLTNLVGNAIKFTERGTVTLAVDVVREHRSAAAVRFAVRDTGMGIPADRQRAIFESFTQADASTTSKYGGTGLGLTISRQLVALMGGTLEVESRVGAGSAFSFVLDLAPAAPGADSVAA